LLLLSVRNSSSNYSLVLCRDSISFPETSGASSDRRRPDWRSLSTLSGETISTSCSFLDVGSSPSCSLKSLLSIAESCLVFSNMINWAFHVVSSGVLSPIFFIGKIINCLLVKDWISRFGFDGGHCSIWALSVEHIRFLKWVILPFVLPLEIPFNFKSSRTRIFRHVV
jgi:hypothetical protein